METIQLLSPIRHSNPLRLQVFLSTLPGYDRQLIAKVYTRTDFAEADLLLKSAIRHSGLIGIRLAPVADSTDFTVTLIVEKDEEKEDTEIAAEGISGYRKGRKIQKIEGEVAMRTYDGCAVDGEKEVRIESFGPFPEVEKANVILERAVMMVALKHPGNQRLLDIAVTRLEGKRGFKLHLVTEALKSIEALVSEAKLTEEAVLKLLLEVVSGLIHAKSKVFLTQKLPHCHIDPSCLYLTPEGTTVLGNYRLQRERKDVFVENSPYFSPEIFNIGTQVPDFDWFSTDIYSLAATAFYLLEGRAPTLGTSDEIMLLGSMQSELSPLHCSDKLKKLVMMMTCFHPEHRLSAEAVQAYLLTITSSIPIECMEAVSSMSFGALKAAEVELTRLTTTCGSDAQLTDIQFKLTAVYFALEKYEKAEECAEKNLELRKAIYGDEHIETAKAYFALSRVCNRANKLQKSGEMALKCLSIQEPQLGRFHMDIATSFNNLYEINIMVKNLNAAENLAKKCMKVRELLFGPKHHDTIEAYADLMLLYFRGQNIAEFEAYLIRILSADKEQMPKSTSTAIIHLNVAKCFDEIGKLEEAEEHKLWSLSLLRGLGGEHTLLECKILISLARTHQLMKKYPEAEVEVSRAILIQKDLSGRIDKNVCSSILHLSKIYFLMNRYQEAEAVLLELVRDEPLKASIDQQVLESIYSNLSAVYCAQNNLAPALEYTEKELALNQQLLGESNPQAILIYNRLADLAARLDKNEELRGYLLKCLKLLTQHFGEDNMDAATLYEMLSVTASKLDNNPEAIEFELKSIAILERLLPKKSPMLAKSYTKLASAYTQMNNFHEAEKYLKQCLSIDQDELETALTQDLLCDTCFGLGRIEEAFKLGLACTATIERFLGDKHPKTDNMYEKMIVISMKLRKTLELETFLRKHVSALNSLLEENHPKTLRATEDLAKLLCATTQFAQAEQLALKVLAGKKATLPENDPQLEDTFILLSQIYAGLGRLSDAEAYASKTMAMRQSQSPTDTAMMLLAMSGSFEQANNLPEAESLALKAYNMQVAVHGEHHPEVVSACRTLVVLYNKMQRFKEAEKFCLQVLRINKERFGEDSPKLNLEYQNLASLCLKDQRFQEALELTTTNIGILKQHPEKGTDLTDCYHLLSQAYSGLCNLPEAEKYLLMCIASHQDNNRGSLVGIGRFHIELCFIYGRMAMLAKSEEHAKLGLELLTPALGEHSPQVSAAVVNLASIYLKTKRVSEAEALLLRSVEAQERVFGDQHPLIADSYEILMELYAKKMQLSKATELCLKCIRAKEAAREKNSTSLAKIYLTLANLHQAMGNFDLAEEVLTKWYSSIQGKVAEDDPKLLSFYTMMHEISRRLGKTTEAEDYLQKLKVILDREACASVSDEATALSNAAKACIATGQRSEAEVNLLKLVNLRKQVVGETDLEIADLYESLGMIALDQNNFAEAEERINKCIEIRTQHPSDAQNNSSRAYCTLLKIYLKVQRPAEAEAAGLKAIELDRQFYGENSMQVASIRMLLGNVYQATGRHLEAIQAYTQYIEARCSSPLSENSPDIADLYEHLTELYLNTNQLEKAEHAAKKVISIHRMVVGDDHLVMSVAFNSLMQVYQAMEKFPEAEECGLKSLEIYSQKSHRPNQNLCALYMSLSSLYMRMGKMREAEDFGLKLLSLEKEINRGVDDLRIEKTYFHLAALYIALGKLEEAETYSVSLIGLLEQQIETANSSTADAYNMLARVYFSMGRIEDAAELTLKALNIMRPLAGEKDLNIIKTCTILSGLYEKLEQWDQAEEYAKQALAAGEGVEKVNEDMLQELRERLERAEKRGAKQSNEP